MKDYIENRVIEIARYILETQSTVRKTAKEYNISKSTVHKDVTERLAEIDAELAKKVHSVLDINKAERHLRGGLATMEKYLKLAKSR